MQKLDVFISYTAINYVMNVDAAMIFIKLLNRRLILYA